MAYEALRDEARERFEAVCFREGEGRAALDEIRSATLARFDAEIAWYEDHAGKRRFASSTVRLLAVALGTVSLLFLNVRAFSSAPATGLSFGSFGIELTVLATALAILAGGVLLLDNVLQITRRFAYWRVTEYTLRIMRSDFEIAFLRAYGAMADEEIDRATVNEARILATAGFKAVEEEIKSETESWQGDMEKAMAALRQRIESEREKDG